MNREVKSRGIKAQNALMCIYVLLMSHIIFLPYQTTRLDLDQIVPLKPKNNTNQIDLIGKQQELITPDEAQAKIKSNSYLTMYGEHRVQPALDHLPKWLIDYFAWHKGQVTKATDQTKYMVITCIGKDKCGGFSDRLRTMPFYLLLASKVERVLCIYWSNPFGLEHLMTPPAGGMDWRCPTEFGANFVDFKRRSASQSKFRYHSLFDRRKTNAVEIVERVITDMKQSNDRYVGVGLRDQDFIKITKLNNMFNSYSYREQYPVNEKWFHVDLSEHIYRVMFEPAEPIAKMINATMTRLALVENNYTAVHVRARYPTLSLKNILGNQTESHDKGQIDVRFDGRLKRFLVEVANNALECGSLLDPSNQLFFSSDNMDLTDFILRTPFVMNITNGTSIRTYQPIGVDQRAEIKHLGAIHHEGADPTDFYPIIEDLFIMGGARCVSHGIGSFGAFAAGLSGNRCRAIHRKHRGGGTEKCPNSRSAIVLKNITKDELLFNDEVTDDAAGRFVPVTDKMTKIT